MICLFTARDDKKIKTEKSEVECCAEQRKNWLSRLFEDSEFINPWKWTEQLSHLFRSSLKYQEVGGSWTKDIKGGS